ncbi:hypothetical protein [Delftia acidovorans]|uniref:hypothetical protein n=1 Tax=Delftia acidovorans TaxID=80866 RepID=UPI001EDE9D36|nr:hypothetical protein [Delftia acidovorans]MCG3782748.1 hypothetical protein [Delftia acidovorans]
MADFWPVVFSLAQIAQAACLVHLSGRVARVLALRPRPFAHIVCKPGDVVCIALPEGLSASEVAKFREAAIRFGREASVDLQVFEGGFQIIGAAE